jgi:hypothetical protein
VIVAYLRPDSWSLPLFLHVLGATLLFGATLATAVLAVAGRRDSAKAALLSRCAFVVMLVLVVPAWILMRAGGQWIASKEFPGNTPGWLGVGFIVSDAGIVVVIALAVLTWLAARRGGVGKAAAAVAVIAPLYLVALAVAWFAMSAKPGS